ncbi:MAG: hypothetical protein ACRBCL_13090 [Maritimibacter sp.]
MTVLSIRKFAVAAALCLSGTAAFAQESEARLAVELNGAAETDAGACRLTFVAANQTGIALDRTAYEIALFDAGGTVTRLLLLEFGALVEGKTKILQFELAETGCATISRLVVNDVAACDEAGGTATGICLSALEASSRTAIQFGI